MTNTLADLISLPESNGLDFHSGVVIEFDPVTGSNLINVLGALVPDLPMLNIGDTTNLAAGDVVGLLKVQHSYMIIGRVVLPNSQVFATSAVSFFAEQAASNGHSITTTGTTVVTVTVPVPDWANRGLVTAVGFFGGKNSRVVDDFLYGAVWISGVTGGENLQDIDTGSTGSVGAAHYATGVVIPGGGSFAVEGKVRTNGGTWAADSLNNARLSVAVTFTKIPD